MSAVPQSRQAFLTALYRDTALLGGPRLVFWCLFANLIVICYGSLCATSGRLLHTFYNSEKGSSSLPEGYVPHRAGNTYLSSLHDLALSTILRLQQSISQ